MNTELQYPVSADTPRQPPEALNMRVYSDLDRLPDACLHLFEKVGRGDFFMMLPWFRNFAATALEPGNRLRIYTLEDEQRQVRGIFAARSSGRKLFAATSFYSCSFSLHLPDWQLGGRAALRSLALGIAAEKPKWHTIEISPLDVEAEIFPMLVEAFHEAGFAVQTFFSFGNWRLTVNGKSFSEYVNSLPSAVRNTLSRKRKKLERSGRADIQIFTSSEKLDKAIEDYTKVYRASWKHPEPYPDFIPGLIRMCAGMGSLRLGLVYIDGEPAAAQLWVIHNRSALIYKLAYDERFVDLSVGTILTAALMQYVLDTDKVDEVDYLSGDDRYKKDWMSYRRERWGILAMNPRTVRGVLAILRHVGGRKIKRAGMWVRDRIRCLRVSTPTAAS